MVHSSSISISTTVYFALLKRKGFSTLSASSTVTIDFEKAMQNAFLREFLNVKLDFFFHFCYGVFRSVQRNFLQRLYESNSEFDLRFRMLSTIVFISAEKVVETFKMLCDYNIFLEEAQYVLDYFEVTWIGSPRSKNMRISQSLLMKNMECL